MTAVSVNMAVTNLVMDAVEPQRLGRFWEAVVGGERLTDEPDGFETRLTIEGTFRPAAVAAQYRAIYDGVLGRA